jgi:hypothetical protein
VYKKTSAGVESEIGVGGGGGITDITYADLVTAIGVDGLIAGAQYCITDFQTVHYIVDGVGTRYDNQAQIDTVTLTGTGGFATITGAGGLTKTVTWTTDLAGTAETFVDGGTNVADYAAVDIALTHSGATIVFTSTADGAGYHHFTNPVIANATDDLAGTVANTQMNGYILAAAVEPLIVTALSTNTISHEVKSILYPQDIIHYDWNSLNWMDDTSFADAESGPATAIIAGFKGVIYFRHDTKNDNYMGYDFRNVKNRRWKPNPVEWEVDVGYAKGSYVKSTSNDSIYRSLKDIGEVQVDTVTLTGTDGTANITAAGGLTKLVTFAGGLTQTAADFVTSWAADYLPAIIVTSVDGTIIFTAAVIGTAFTNPVITNVSGSLDGTVVNTNANVAVPTIQITDTDYWIAVIDLSVIEYCNCSPITWNGITSGEKYTDYLTFVDQTSTYEGNVFNNHIEPTKDNYTVFHITGSIIPNNVVFLGLGYFSYNTIGSGFYYNTVGNDFYCNIIGNSFYCNIIGNGFYSNTIRPYFSYNTIRTNFYYNTIGNDFSYNTIGNDSYCNIIGSSFNNNTIRNDFSYNTIGNKFAYNTIENSFKMNRAEDIFQNIDFTAATHVYASYNCTLGTDAIGNAYLTYIGGSPLALQLVLPTT